MHRYLNPQIWTVLMNITRSCLIFMYLTNDLFKTAAYYQEDKSMVNYRKLDSQDRTWLQKIVEDFRNQHISEEKARAFLDDTHICVYTVSYTHLDVYKRQVSARLVINRT